MKLTTRDKNLLIFLFSIIIVAGAYYIGFNIISNKTEEVKTKNAALTEELNHKKEIYEKKDFYIEKTKEYDLLYENNLKDLKNDISQPELIRFARDFESKIKIEVPSLILTNEENVASLSYAEDDNNPLALYKSTVSYPVDTTADKYVKALDYIQSYKTRTKLANFAFTYDILEDKVTSNFDIEQYCVK